jgi:lysophospholipase L1-like esterase
VQNDDCFAALLREKLTNEGHRDWDVVNAGVPGYSSYQSLVYLKQILDRWQPEIVIVESGINDGIPSIGLSDRQASTAGGRSWLDEVAWHSNVVLALRYARQDMVAQPFHEAKVESEPFFHSIMFDPGRSRVPEDDFRANLEEFEDLAGASGAIPFFMFPGLYNEYGRGNLEKSVRFDHPREIDMVAAIKSAGSEDLSDYFLPYDEAHLSRRGHRLVANLIWSRLVHEEVFEPEN